MIKFKDVNKSKSLGMITSAKSIGVSTKVHAEVVDAEYSKDSDGSFRVSSGGNKLVRLNCKVEKEVVFDNGEKRKVPQYFNVQYYATDNSPSLSDVKPSKKLSRYVEVQYNTGGAGSSEKYPKPFGSLSLRNYENKDGDLKSNVSIFGANVQKALKKGGNYMVKDFDGQPMPFVKDEEMKVNVKGFVADIKDTEKFIKNNYNEDFKRLDFDVYYMENDGDDKYDDIMPVSLENIKKDRVMDFVKFIKNSTDTVIGMRGSVKSYPIYADKEEESEKSSVFGEYEFTGGREKIGYEVRLLIDYDEVSNNWKIVKTKNTGELIVENGEFDFDNVETDDDPF